MSRRIRTIKPEILDDDKTASLSHVAWRLFVSALSLSDDHGNLRAGVTYLSGQVFHSCQDTDPDTVRAAVAELAEVGLWTVYNVRGQTYAHIRGWSKHQRIDNAGKPKVPGPNEADGTDPISAEAKNKVRGESRRVAASRGESPRVAAVRGGSRLEGDREREVDQEGRGESAGASAHPPPRVYAHEEAPPTSPVPVVLATVVSTEAPPSRTPPAPVSVMPPVEDAPSCDETAPLAASGAEDDDQPPPAQRVPSTPRPEPVAVEAAPVAPAPVTSAQTSLLPGEPSDEPAPVVIPKVSALAPSTPVNRILRSWGALMYRDHQQPLATEARRRAVRDRLRVFSEDDLARALSGAMQDPYVNGSHDRAPSGGQRDIAWLFAKVERVEEFLRKAPTPKAPPAPPVLRQPPPLPPHLAARAARMPVPTLADFLERGFAAPPSPRMTAAQIDAALADKETAHAC